VTPQAVDTSSLRTLGEPWRAENPFVTQEAAIKIGTSAYNQNCARCHGLEAVSGGIAPDLRKLDNDNDNDNDCASLKDAPKKAAHVKGNDDYFLTAVRHGRTRNGAVVELVHVPVDRPLMDANQQVSIFALCYRERVAMARLLERVPALDAMGQIGPLPMAVPGQSLAGWLLIGADGGAYRSQLSTQWKDGTECARALLRGEIAVAAGLSFELESVLRGNAAVAMGRCLRRLRSAKDGPPGWW